MADVRRADLAAQAALRDFPKPSVAMIRGHCIDGGAEIATACDLHFSAPSASSGAPREGGHRLHAGVDPGADGSHRSGQDHDLLLIGELIDAPTAQRVGLVDRLVEADDLEAEVRRFADVVASRSALSQRATKEVVAALTAGGDGAEVAMRWYRETVASGELAEGVTAFTSRRTPRFPWSG